MSLSLLLCPLDPSANHFGEQNVSNRDQTRNVRNEPTKGERRRGTVSMKMTAQDIISMAANVALNCLDETVSNRADSTSKRKRDPQARRGNREEGWPTS